MDGTVHLTHYSIRQRRRQQQQQPNHSWSSSASAGAGAVVSFVRVESRQEVCRHARYVRCLAWNHHQEDGGIVGTGSGAGAAVLASASADGVLQLHRVEKNWAWVPRDDDEGGGDDAGVRGAGDGDGAPLTISRLASFHLPGAVEALCFLSEASLLCYARGTPYFTVLDVSSDLGATSSSPSSPKQATARIHLNSSVHDDHVSFCVLQASSRHHGRHVLAATDAHRNFVLDASSGKIVRNFYGHANDAYSHPRACWSRSGRYALGNNTEDGAVLVWDVASSQVADFLALPGESQQSLRDMYSSPSSDALVTTSFDKTTNLWFYEDRAEEAMSGSLATAPSADSNAMEN
jgi:WD40 repeat protein